MPRERDYWFPAKRYGWGWGPPVTWQGWSVLAVYLGTILAGVLIFPPHISPVHFALVVLVPTVVFVSVCYATGEPPGWRWGDKGRR